MKLTTEVISGQVKSFSSVFQSSSPLQKIALHPPKVKYNDMLHDMNMSTLIMTWVWCAQTMWILLCYYNTSTQLKWKRDETYACKAVFLGRGGMVNMWSFPEDMLLFERDNHLNYCLQDNLREREKKVMTKKLSFALLLVWNMSLSLCKDYTLRSTAAL